MMVRTAPDRLAKRTQLMHALRRSPGASRAQLARELQVSIGTIRLLTEELTAGGLLAETGVNLRTGGRPSVRLALNGQAGHVLGVDLGGVDMRVGLYDFAGSELEMRTLPFRRVDGVVDQDQVVEQVAALAAPLSCSLLGIGLAVPGQLDISEGKVIYSANLGWRDVPLQARLSAETGSRVRVERNSTVGLLAEDWWGEHEQHDVVVFVSMGSGVGASIRYGNEFFRGETGMAGELGHVVVDPSGPTCRCGRNGCLETFASLRAIQTRFDSLRRLDSPRTDLLDALAEAEPLALEAVKEAGRYLGSSLTSLVNLLNPGMVILSGQLMGGTEHLVASLEDAVRDRSLPHSGAGVKIVASALGENATVRGAAALVLDAAYKGAMHQEEIA